MNSGSPRDEEEGAWLLALEMETGRVHAFRFISHYCCAGNAARLCN